MRWCVLLVVLLVCCGCGDVEARWRENREYLLQQLDNRFVARESQREKAMEVGRAEIWRQAVRRNLAHYEPDVKGNPVPKWNDNPDDLLTTQPWLSCPY